MNKIIIFVIESATFWYNFANRDIKYLDQVSENYNSLNNLIKK